MVRVKMFLVSKRIANNSDFARVIKSNFNRMFRGEHINTSLNFVSNPNLYFAFGNVDILDLHINKEGDIEAYVLDTYDFNKGGINPLVNIGRKLQDNYALYGYYTLTKIICD